ncbi:MAG TPA: AsmA-like C-terminal region-containing protein [Gemmatimonadales bacterium]|nr:AsmA-like C-terminal region-containing protein [Gemmatimonadales bacterium]
MTRRTRILALAGTLIALLLVLLVVLPLLFRDRIAQRVKAEVNRSVEARVDWRDVGLTFFRDFPNLTLRLDDLTAVGLGRFEGDTLASVGHLGVVLDLASVVRSALGGDAPVVVRSIELDRPRLSLVKLEDGTANWDIMKETPEAERPAQAGKAVGISLRRFEIRDAAVALHDAQGKLEASVIGYDQSLTGDFSEDLFAIRTTAGADTVSVTFAGVPYLNRVRLDLTADVQADLARKSFTLKDTELRLNDLRLGASGSATTAGENVGLDLAFKAPSTNFRSILSLVPAVYAHDFESVKTSGTIEVSGQVKGEYGDSAFPSFALNAKVDDAAFQYPDLPLPARDIAMDLSISNPGGNADSTVVNLKRFHLRLGQNPVDAAMTLRTPLSDPDLDARVRGKVDLADVRRTVKLEGIDELAGTIAADAAVRTRMSYVDRQQYDRVAASGTVDVGNLTVKGKTLPRPLSIQEASLRLAPQRADLRSFRGTIGSSDLQASGTLDNLLGFALRDDVLRGTATVSSKRFNLDEWRSGEGELQIIPVPANIDFGLDATVAELTYDKLRMTNARGRLRVKDQKVTLENFRMNTLGGEFGVTGFYETTDSTRPTFDVGLKMTKVDIPAAFQALTTVQMLAPVAKYARGNFSTDLKINGALGRNMIPLFDGLDGGGSLQTSQLVLQDFPALDKVVDLTKLQFLDDPALRSISTAFQIRDGRLHVNPFAVNLGPTTMNVSGSNGLDQSLQYTLRLKVPRSELGQAANQAVAGLISRAGAAGVDLPAASAIDLGIQLGGTVTNPEVKVDAASVVSDVKQGLEQAVQEGVAEKVDSAAAKLVQQAEQQAAGIRKEARALAETTRRQGYQQADALEKQATNPLLQAAAKAAADKLRKETDAKAAGIVRDGDKRADGLVAEARRRANTN